VFNKIDKLSMYISTGIEILLFYVLHQDIHFKVDAPNMVTCNMYLYFFNNDKHP